jgi:hypothetical protein
VLLLFIVIGFVLTIVVWANFGPAWGFVTGLLLIGGIGWKALFAVGGAIAGPRRETGVRRGLGSTSQRNAVRPLKDVSAAWRIQEGRPAKSGESAASWMDRTMGISPGAPIYGYRRSSG